MKTRKLLNELLPDLLLMLISAACLLPFLILLSSSLSSNASVIRKGYSLLPVDIDLEAYRYLFGYASGILHALTVSLFVTAAGTAVSLAVTAMAAYPLSRKGLPFRRFFTIYILITMEIKLGNNTALWQKRDMNLFFTSFKSTASPMAQTVFTAMNTRL